MKFCLQVSSVEIHGITYKKGSWLVTSSRMYCGILHPHFSRVKDILSRGQTKTPILIMNNASLINYLPNMRAYLVTLTPFLVSIIHSSSLLFYEPMSFHRKGENFIIKSRVDLTAFLENNL